MNRVADLSVWRPEARRMKLVILDRDGTINEDSAEFVKSPERVACRCQGRWRRLPGSTTPAGMWWWPTNQSGLGRGLFDVSTLNAMHAKMHTHAGRRGRPGGRGLLLPARAGGRAAAAASPSPACLSRLASATASTCAACRAVGDSPRDVLAGAAVGCAPHLVLTGKGAAYARRSLPEGLPPDTRVHRDLAAFADFLIQ